MKLNKISQLLITLVFLFAGTAIAEDSEELKESKERAAIAKANKEAAENERDFAKAIADKAIAEQDAIQKLDKTKADAEAAEYKRDLNKANLYKALIPTAPDTEKLKLPTPTGFEFKTSINQRVFQNSISMAEMISQKIINSNKTKNIILNSPNLENVPSTYNSVKNTLTLSQEPLAQENKLFQTVIDGKKLCKPEEKPKNKITFSTPIAAAYVVSELLKATMGFAIALKPQYALANTEVAVDQSEFIYELANKLISKKLVVIDPDKIIPVSTNSELDTLLRKLDTEKNNSQQKLITINLQTCELSTDAIEGAKKLKASLDIVTKSIDDLFTVNASRVVRYDQAKKAEELMTKLLMTDVAILQLDVVRKANDTFAKESVFSSRKVFNAANVQVKWTLTKPDGTLLLSGIEQSTADWALVNLPD